METIYTPDQNELRRISELPTEPALRQAAAFLADLARDRTFQVALILPLIQEAEGEKDWYVACRYQAEDGAFSPKVFVWPSGTGTRIHDHSSWGAYCCASGAVLEERYERFDDGSHSDHARLKKVWQLWWSPEDGASTVLPADDGIHRVGNPGDETAVSVHLYGPSVSEVDGRDYDPIPRPRLRPARGRRGEGPGPIQRSTGGLKVNTRKEGQTMKTTNTVLAALWRLGRGTAKMMGLAMLLALSVGLASTALAGTGIGARFDLGKTNTVNAVSKLVGNVAGPSLQIDNNSANGAATALNLLVEVGKAPMKVNPEAGTATNLSADKLDGKSADEIGVNGLELVFSDSAFNSTDFKQVTASCPAGKVVVGTGYDIYDDKQGIQEATDFGVIAVFTGTEDVSVRVAEQAPTSANWGVTANATCATGP